MDNTPVYIKKILALLLVVVIGLFLSRIVSYYFYLPFCFFTLAFLVWRITGEKPYFLYGMGEAENYLHQKGGFWLLFKWVFGFFGILYDVVAMILNGVYQLFIIFIDILLFIKTILYWIIHAILWFFSLYVPPLVFLFRNAIHYLLKWPWWIYKLAYRNTGISINKNFYRVSFPGAFYSLLIFTVFLGAGVVSGISALIYPGIAFALLPLAWSGGAISFIRKNNLAEAKWSLARISFNGGFDTLRALLFYLSIVLIFLLSEILLNLLGWIPVAGFSLLNISLNINTLLSVLILFLGVILLFANLILPPHIVINNIRNSGLRESIQFLGIIGRMFLRYTASLIPVSIFSAFLLLIPVLIISLAIFLTLSLRDNIVDSRIDLLQGREMLSSVEERHGIRKNIKLLQYYKGFPQNALQEFGGIRELSIREKNLNQNLEKGREDIRKMEDEFNTSTDSLKQIIGILNLSTSDTLARFERDRMQSSLESRTAGFESWKSLKLLLISEMKADIAYSKALMYQLPIVLLLLAVWVSFFGGIIFMVFISYAGNVFHELYTFREDGKITFFNQLARNIKRKDSNQPLLGFTLLFLTVLILIFVFRWYNVFS